VTREQQSQGRKRKARGADSSLTVSLILACALILFYADRAFGQSAELAAPKTRLLLSPGNDATPTLVIGFVGGFVHRDDVRHSEVQLAQHLEAMYGDRVKIEIFKNRQRIQAHNAVISWLNLLENNCGADHSQRRCLPRVILFGHSWGASAVVYTARELERDDIPVALTVQVDSIRKHGEDDSVIPANVSEAVNFYQSKGILHGRSKISAADPTHTTIVGNFRINYEKQPAECHTYPWYDRLLFKGHTAIECDPRVWSQVEKLIEAHIPPALLEPAPTEIAAGLVER